MMMVLEVSRKVDLFFIKSLEDIYPKKMSLEDRNFGACGNRSC